jgi:GT2 family glycosyltransferase
MGQSIFCDSIIFPESRSENLATIRNGLVEQAFKAVPDLTHILWLDGDQVFPKDMVQRLLDHDKDIVGAWVNIRQNRKANVYKILYQNKRGGFKHRSYTKQEIKHFLETEPLQKVERFGFGSLLIKRKVWETIPKPWFGFDEHHACEDLYFCDKAREAGFEMWVDWSIRSLHISITYL